MNCIYEIYTSLAFCTPSALRKSFLDAHRMQSDVSILKKLTRCSALASSRIAKQNSQIAPLRLRRVAFLFVLFACQMCAHFCMRACKMSARLTGLFQKMSGSRLLSHIVSNIVPSAARIFTVVFGMGTGVASARIATRQIYQSVNTFPFT